MATKKKLQKRRYRVRTRVQLDGWQVLLRMQRAGLDTAGLAAAMGRSAATVAAMLQKIDDRTVQMGTALRVARALGCEVAALRRSDSDAMEAGHEG